MKTRYMLLISATLSLLLLQAKNVDAATSENENETIDRSVQIQDSKQSSDTSDKDDIDLKQAATTSSQTINNGFESSTTAQNNAPTNHSNQTVKIATNNNNSNIQTKTVDKNINNRPMTQTKSNAEPSDNFDHMLQSWKDVTVGETYYSKDNQEMNQISKQQDTNVTNLWDTMNKGEEKDNLWSGAEELTTSANITTDYRNLESMAIAVANPGSKYYQNKEMINDIVDGFNWMSENKYNSNIKAYGNWWDWEIGTPLFINNIVMIMRPYLTTDQVQTAMDAITKFVPDPNYFRGSVNPKYHAEATGANQVDISKVKIVQAILEKDDVALRKAVDSVEKVFPLVKSGEGFYSDGSFIQHENIGYNGSYGNVLMDGVSQLLPVLQNTPYSLSDSAIKSINFWVENGFAPFIYKGNLMDMVRGRAISRGVFQSNVAAADLIRSIVRVVDTYPTVQKEKYQSLIKYWLSFGNNYDNYIKQITSFRDIALISEIMNNPEIHTNDFQNQNLYNFAKMDKVLLKNSDGDYAVTINMSSNRIQRYESLNNENLHGWYTGDGMVYVYNNDLNQFNKDYWATVDPYKLPGTTETTAVQKDASGTKVSPKSFVGASTFGNIGSVGNVGSVAMDFINNDLNLSAHKSWFLTHDNVVALGSAIDNTSKNQALTVIDNRKLDDQATYKIYINGKIFEPKLNVVNQLKGINSIYLQSSKEGASIGYKFITPQDLNLDLTSRTGAWADINKAQSKDQYNRKFLEIYKVHQVNNDTYNYVIYPNLNLEKFNQAKLPTIIANKNNIQAVSFGKNIGVNVFSTGEETVDDMVFDDPISLTRINNGNQKIIGISDPSQNKNIVTSFKIKDNNYQILNQDKSLDVKLIDGYWNISLTDTGHDGTTHAIYLAKK